MFEDDFFDATLSSGDLPPVRTREAMSGARAIAICPKWLRGLVGFRTEIEVFYDSRREACAVAIEELLASNQIKSAEERDRFMQKYYPDVWAAYRGIAALKRIINRLIVSRMPRLRGYSRLFVGPDWKIYVYGDDPLERLFNLMRMRIGKA